MRTFDIRCASKLRPLAECSPEDKQAYADARKILVLERSAAATDNKAAAKMWRAQAK